MMSRCSVPAVVAAADDSGEIMLFGVRVKVDPMRKSVSMNNLSEYEQPNHQLTAAAAPGYASADDTVHHHSAASRERKRGVPWTEEEHKLFLLGLQKVGKGDWRGISRNFVKTRTPTQVASHAQKYFLRRSNLNRRRRRSSLFDITTDSVTAIEEHFHQDSGMQSPETPKNSGFPVAPYSVLAQPAVFPIHTENLSGGQVNNASSVLLGTISGRPLLKSPAPSTAVDSNHILTKDDPTLSLNLSLSFNHHEQLSSIHSTYQVARSFSNGDGMISVV